jgi:hypothetical protein
MKRKRNLSDKEEKVKPNIVNFFLFFLYGMGDKRDKFDTSYSIQTAEEKEFGREQPA